MPNKPTEDGREHGGDPLPRELEAAVLRVLSGPVEDRRSSVETLCVTNPPEADAIRRFAASRQPDVDADDRSARTASVEERLARLRARPPVTRDRYVFHGEIGHGGMGAVMRVRDLDLGRNLAMKVILGSPDVTAAGGDTPAVDPEVLQRFLEEAQITGQLDHPGVVPVHELGIDDRGQIYFTMRLVRGDTVDEIFAKALRGEEGWGRTRAIEIILKVCDTVAFAHQKGVVHRDLKPSNVMVGKFGEVYVMDWGLAKVLGQPDRRDLRPRRQPSSSRVVTDRSRDNASADSPLLTMDGTVVGTPSYMAPEQAEGRVELVDHRADVYAVGAMLYQLLTGVQPYVKPGARVSPHTILAAVHAGPPVPVHQIDRSIPTELVAICERAMARRIDERYQHVRELAEDLRAYLDKRVVKAYRTGAVAELSMWMRRNRALAASLAAAVLALVAGIVVSTTQYFRAETNLARFNLLANFGHLETARGGAEALHPPWPERVEAMEQWLLGEWNVLSEALPGLRRTVLDLRAAAAATPDNQDELDEARRQQLEPLEAKLAWLKQLVAVRRQQQTFDLEPLPADLQALPADELTRRAWNWISPDRGTYGREALGLAMARRAQEIATDTVSGRLRPTLAYALAANGLERDAVATCRAAYEAAPEPRKAQLEFYMRRLEFLVGERNHAWQEREIGKLERRVSAARAAIEARAEYRLEDPGRRFLHDTLSRLVADIEAFEFEAVGEVRRRLAWARDVQRVSIDEHRERWTKARRAITTADDRIASRLYAAEPIELRPQLGLVPIGMNPVSKLWEFWHLLSAAPGAAIPGLSDYDELGRLPTTIESGIVLVLVPGGTFRIGAQSADPQLPNYDAWAHANESPTHEIAIAPFFIGKHEVTQAQWERLTNGDNPSDYHHGFMARGMRDAVTLEHPVEQVTWLECDRELSRIGLMLPTEAQWEYACRADTDTPWCSGDQPIDLKGYANVLDETGRAAFGTRDPDVFFDDGFIVPAPIGSFRPNRFGLLDMHGNVWEWCADWIASYENRYTLGTALREPGVNKSGRVLRGGSARNSVRRARASDRNAGAPSKRQNSFGVRAARRVYQ